MATIEEISEIRPHPNADRLELVQILGYQCVVPKDVYHVGDRIIFIQPDNVLPADAEWATEYRKYAPKRIKAIKLRKEWSEGLVIDLAVYQQEAVAVYQQVALAAEIPEPGTDVSTILNVVHYEPPTPAGLAAQGIVAALPYQLPKTDEKRWEEIRNKLPFGITVDVTLKVDGQSWSAYYKLDKDEFGILGRRLAFPLRDDGVENDYTAQNARYDIETKLRKYCQEQGVSLCIRGESYGGGIQNSAPNPHCKLNKGLAIFSVYLIDEHRYAGKGDRYYFKTVCQELGLPMVPILEESVVLTPELVRKYSTEINKLPKTVAAGAFGGKPFEGVVVKGAEFSCKVINKDYDSKK